MTFTADSELLCSRLTAAGARSIIETARLPELGSKEGDGRSGGQQSVDEGVGRECVGALGERAMTADRPAWRSDIPVIAAISIFWMMAVMLADPSGNFPLNDDWNYARTVKWLLEEGRWGLTCWSCATLVSQALWGALVCKIFGFSFETLRLSALALGLFGIVATYFLLRELRADRFLAFIGALVLATNPLYFNLAHTFMSDVPFLTATLWACLFLVKTLKEDRTGDLILGAVFSLVSVMSRQLGMVIPVSFAASYLAKSGPSLRSLPRAFFPLAVSAACLVPYLAWIKLAVGLPECFKVWNIQLASMLQSGFFKYSYYCLANATIVFIYLGVMALPFLVAVAPRLWKTLERREQIFLTLLILEVVLIAGVGLAVKQLLMPLSSNIIFNIGLGPVLLPHAGSLIPAHWPKAPLSVWITVTILGVVAGSALLGFLILLSLRFAAAKWRPAQPQRDWQLLFLLYIFVLYTLQLACLGLIDRYLLFLIPGVMAALVAFSGSSSLEKIETWKLPHMAIAMALVLGFGIFSIAGTHDYLSWNRARWQALSDLTDRDGVSPMQINGGWEFNGWYSYEAKYRDKLNFLSGDLSHENQYLVTIGPVPGYDEIRRFRFRRWLPPGNGDIFVLRKAGN